MYVCVRLTNNFIDIARMDPYLYMWTHIGLSWWQPTKDLIGKRRAKTRCLPGESEQPFILDHTLRFLGRQGIPVSRVTLFVADKVEASNYKNALRNSESRWPIGGVFVISTWAR